MHWHPAVVHVPIALLAFALAVDLAALARRRPDWHRFAYAALVVGTAGAVAAVITGNQAAAGLRADPAAAAIQTHEDLATAALLLSLLATLGRLPGFLREGAVGRARHGAGAPATGGRLPLPWLAVSVAAVVLMALAGYRGGELVYEMGVGVPSAAGSRVAP